MKKIILGMVLLGLFCGNVCEAKVFGRRRPTGSSYGNSSGVDTSCAQGVAEGMARKNWVGHFGGFGSLFEGCGSGFSKEQAYNNCCFSKSGMKTVDVGYAQGNNGMWFCCRRYKK